MKFALLLQKEENIKDKTGFGKNLPIVSPKSLLHRRTMLTKPNEPITMTKRDKTHARWHQRRMARCHDECRRPRPFRFRIPAYLRTLRERKTIISRISSWHERNLVNSLFLTIPTSIFNYTNSYSNEIFLPRFPNSLNSFLGTLFKVQRSS